MVNRATHESWQDVWEDLGCPCAGTEGNTNLSGPQKELLTWHWKLGVGMQKVQDIMWESKAIDDDGSNKILPPVISPKFACYPVLYLCVIF